MFTELFGGCSGYHVAPVANRSLASPPAGDRNHFRRVGSRFGSGTIGVSRFRPKATPRELPDAAVLSGKVPDVNTTQVIGDNEAVIVSRSLAPGPIPVDRPTGTDDHGPEVDEGSIQPGTLIERIRRFGAYSIQGGFLDEIPRSP